MNAKILCTWLGLDDKNWPPEPYALLGLKSGDLDPAQIEKTVHERMAKLRGYQLSHPEEATEAMNRVAQAFICLMESASRQARRSCPAVVATAQLPRRAGTNGDKTQKAVRVAPPTKDDTLVLNQTEVDWKNAPPPVRVPATKSQDGSAVAEAVNEKPPSSPAPELPATEILVPVAAPAPTAPAHLTVELAQQSPEAMRGLGTLQAVIHRVDITRHLVTAWKRVGRYLARSGKKLTRPTEENDFSRGLHDIFETMGEFPPILGHPGKPGYRVVALARLEMTPQMFKMLDDTQRENLVRDWEAGHRVLLSHRQFLLWQFKKMRKRGPAGRAVDSLRAILNDHPSWVFVAVASLLVVCGLIYLASL